VIADPATLRRTKITGGSMKSRRALIIFILAAVCLLATPTSESEANAACTYPFVRITVYWGQNQCGYPICTDVLVVVGESGIDCDGNAWSWGNTNPNLYQTYRKEWCEPICN
jgi:hypothetical protein